MIYAVLVLGGIGIIFGIILGIVNKKFMVEEDPCRKAILEVLPGANCGACGYPGCSGCSEAIFEGKAPVDACPVGGAYVAESISKIMGVAVVVRSQVARCRCNGSENNAKLLYNYEGAESCILAKTIFDGTKLCDFGCFGLGSCAKACPFDAIEMINGLPVVDPEKCTACGICVATCPQILMELVPRNQEVFVGCNNLIKGKKVLEGCNVGCIKCGKCEKVCQYDAIRVTDVARIDYDKCNNCGACIKVCPTNCIIRHKITEEVVIEDLGKSDCGGCTACY